jgi:hypothetical protein
MLHTAAYIETPAKLQPFVSAAKQAFNRKRRLTSNGTMAHFQGAMAPA